MSSYDVTPDDQKFVMIRFCGGATMTDPILFFLLLGLSVSACEEHESEQAQDKRDDGLGP